jgi:hypothetical protein
MTPRAQNILDEKKRLLDQINAAILAYDPVLREKTRDILLTEVFGPSDSGNAATNGHDLLTPVLPTNGASVTRLRDLIHRWPPETQAHRALLSAYHLQRVLGYRWITGRQIQNNLKKLGFRLTNVTVATNENAKITPPRMKKIKSRGRKGNYYIVTSTGVRYVENKLNGVEEA